MSKLFKLREWLTVEEAAKHLTTMLEEKVSVADIYRLVLDGHLKLSVNFVNKARVCKGEIVGEAGIVTYTRINPFKGEPGHISAVPEGAEHEVIRSLGIGDDRYINLEHEVVSIEGVWDLMMIGSEQFDIEHEYQMLTNGPEINLTNLEGTFVHRDNVVCRLMEAYDDKDLDLSQFFPQKPTKDRPKLNFLPGGGLPVNCAWVVRRGAISDFLQSIDDVPIQLEKPLSTKERQSLLILLGAICKNAGIDYQARGMATAVSVMTQEIGAPLTEDTIRKYFKEIDGAIAAREH